MVLAPVSNTTNGPDQVIRGIELETTHRWMDNFTTFFNATLLDSEFRDDFSITGMGIDIRKGNEAIYAPNLSFSLGYDFSIPVSSQWNFVSDGDFQFVGERFSGATNLSTEELDTLEILNLRFGLESERLSLTAFVRNALNDVEAISGDATGARLVNQPRSIGVTFTVRY
jgi:outer membrane receptor protein involved in Fe transport